MTEVGFYHLTRTAAAEALGRLLVRTLEAGERAVVWCGSVETLEMVDRVLWADAAWLPHGTEDVALQPILLTLEDGAPNAARYLFQMNGVETARPEAYARIFDMFDGRDAAAVAAARERWKRLKAAGHELTYRQQGPGGWSNGPRG